MKTPKLSHTPSYIQDVPKRDQRKDPQSGDVFRMTNGHVLRVISRETRRPNQHEYGLGTARDYIRYRLDHMRGAEFIIATSSFRKRARGAEIINTWRCTFCYAASHEPAPDEYVVCPRCGIAGCQRGIPKP